MSTAVLDRAFDRIRALQPAEAGAAELALAQALRPVVDSVWPEVAWQSGVLTATGYPVELAWASRDAALRWTCEVAGPETPEADRLRIARRASGIGAKVDVAPWADIQRGQPLRWGAWLGLRQLAGSRRTKVYLELPGGTPAAGPWCDAGAELAARVGGVTWRMAGLNDDGSVEIYARAPELSWSSLRAAARLVDDEGRLAEVVGELAGPVVPRPSGLSLVLSPSGTPLALTWFAIAKHLWGSDGAVRAAMIRTTGAVPHPPASRELYEALSSGPDDGRWRHGMVGVGIDRTGTSWLQAGLRPT